MNLSLWDIHRAVFPKFLANIRDSRNVIRLRIIPENVNVGIAFMGTDCIVDITV